MKLKIDFEELAAAFEETDPETHYFIDTKNNELVRINEIVEEHADEQLEKMDNERYIPLPPQSSEGDFFAMELFVFELAETDYCLAEQFHKELEKKKPFKNFKALLSMHPAIKEPWFKFKNNEAKNKAINWLCENNIELENQKLTPDIEISEMKEAPENLPEEMDSFRPIGCMNCRNEKKLKGKYFLLNAEPENALMEKEVHRIMEEKFGITQYGHFAAEGKVILLAARCPCCGSENIFWDY